MTLNQSRSTILLLLIAIFVLSIASILDIFARDPSTAFRNLKQQEAEQEIQRRIQKEGTESAWVFLKKMYLSNGRLLPGTVDPHSLAHDIGKAFYKEKGLAGLGICDDSFTDGCFHGVINGMVLERGFAAASKIGPVCLTQTDPISCAHGAGHGLIEATGFDMAKALQSCDEFPESLSPDCGEGVIMGDGWTWSQRERLIEKDPWTVCKQLSKKYQLPCASGMGNYFGYMSNRPLTSERLARICLEAPSAGMTAMCLLRVSQSIVKKAGGDGVVVKKECLSMPEAAQKECLLRAANFLISAGFIDRDTPTEALCKEIFDYSSETCPLLAPLANSSK